MEHLRVTLGILLLVNQQLSSHHHQNVSIWRSWLSIQSRNSVGNLLEWQRHQLLHDILSTLQLGGLERQHRLFFVQVAQLVSVRVELLVVEVAELGGHGIEVNCLLVSQWENTRVGRSVVINAKFDKFVTLELDSVV